MSNATHNGRNENHNFNGYRFVYVSLPHDDPHFDWKINVIPHIQ